MNNIFNAIPVIGVRRHRVRVDGRGITTLVAFHSCPLHCKYCINPQCNTEDDIQKWVTPRSLYHELMRDDIYFRSTGGGVCFGGGEPLLRYPFIKEFKKICGDNWKITAETSLNVPWQNVGELIDIIDEFIVDIKDMSSAIYKTYTGIDNDNVLNNLHFIADKVGPDKVMVRVPLIPQYNTEQDVERSIEHLSSLGMKRFDRFVYITKKISEEDKQIGFSKRSMGKAKCEVLKKVRLTIAEANGIAYSPAICNHKGDCLGTCPKCEQELKMISEELWKRESEGIMINL